MNKRFWFIVALIAIIGIVLIALLSNSSSAKTSSTKTSDGATTASLSVINDVTSVPTSTLSSVGSGTASALPQSISGTTLEEENKPEVLYVGAEYCPYCATERWAMTIALSKFGTFSGLKQTHSSGSDVYPNTQTLSFYGSTFTSSYIVFQPIELYTNIPDGGGYTTLQTLTGSEQGLVNKYDSDLSIPFIDFGNQYVITGATYDPGVLKGQSASNIASSLSNPRSTIGKAVDGAANTIIAAICKLTSDQPSNICSLPAITKIQGSL